MGGISGISGISGIGYFIGGIGLSKISSLMQSRHIRCLQLSKFSLRKCTSSSSTITPNPNPTSSSDPARNEMKKSSKKSGLYTRTGDKGTSQVSYCLLTSVQER